MTPQTPAPYRDAVGCEPIPGIAVAAASHVATDLGLRRYASSCFKIAAWVVHQHYMDVIYAESTIQ